MPLLRGQLVHQGMLLYCSPGKYDSADSFFAVWSTFSFNHRRPSEYRTRTYCPPSPMLIAVSGSGYTIKKKSKVSSDMQESTHKVRKSASQVVLGWV